MSEEITEDDITFLCKMPAYGVNAGTTKFRLDMSSVHGHIDGNQIYLSGFAFVEAVEDTVFLYPVELPE